MAVLLFSLLVLPGCAGADIGAISIGDPYVPSVGNGGFDIESYSIVLDVDPAASEIVGTATLGATATQRLAGFYLDLQTPTGDGGMEVLGVQVDGAPGDWVHEDDELLVTPAQPIDADAEFTVMVDYAGTPVPSTSSVLGMDVPAGWVVTDDGSVTLDKPRGAASWFPCSDHPSDKATFAISITVPEGIEVISNGIPDQPATAHDRTTWTWRTDEPMATAVVLVAIGQFSIVESTTAAGLPLVNAVDVKLSPSAGSVLDSQEDYLEALESWFGPYPFASAGAVLLGLPMDGPLASLRGPIALDTQTRPVYLSGSTGPPRQALIHELAHQWAGNSVTPATWQDHWLNEAFATYAQWLWAESTGTSIDAVARQHYEGFLRHADDPAIPPAATGPENLFADSVYVRGAMVLHLLRDQIGDDDFFTFVRAWMEDNAHSNVTTQQFMDTAQAYAGNDLQEIFDTWLFEPSPPVLDP